MAYPNESKLRHLLEQLHLYSQLKHEYGALGLEGLWTKAEQELQSVLEEVKALPVDAVHSEQEPNDLSNIRRLRPNGPRRLWNRIDSAVYEEKLEGALFGRIAGNILGPLYV